MLKGKYRRLINQKIDGTISPQQSAKLDKYLEENPEGRKYLEDLILLTRTLKQAPPAGPPLGLKQKIMESITTPTYSAIEGKNLLGRWSSIFESRPRLRLAYAFSAGLVLGVVGLALFLQVFNPSITWDWSQLYGAILSEDPSQKFLTLDRADFDRGDLQGSIITKSTGEIVVTELGLSSVSEVKIVLQFNQDDLSFYGLGGLRHQPKAVSVNRGQIEFTDVGQNQYLFVFRNNPGIYSLLKFKVYSGQLLFERDLITQNILSQKE